MTDPQSVTVWLDRLKAGENQDEAIVHLWNRYFGQLVRRAHGYLAGQRAVADGEDVALSAFDAFVRATHAGRFPRLDDRHDLWAVLLRLTADKARNAVRDENRSKRGGRMACHAIVDVDSGTSGLPLASSDPDPAEAVALAESAADLLRALPDEELRKISQLALEGYTNREIGAAIGKSVAAVERKLRRIRELWSAKGTV